MISRYLNWISANKSTILFSLKMLGLYFLLQSIYDYILKPYTSIDYLIIQNIINVSEDLLSVFGYQLIESNSLYAYHFGIAGTSGVIIGAPCDGLSLFILFSSFIFIFKGKLWFKLTIISVGTLFLHLLNIARVVGLALIVKYFPSTLDFHHSYTFTLFIYGLIFYFWYFRIKIYEKLKW